MKQMHPSSSCCCPLFLCTAESPAKVPVLLQAEQTCRQRTPCAVHLRSGPEAEPGVPSNKRLAAGASSGVAEGCAEQQAAATDQIRSGFPAGDRHSPLTEGAVAAATAGGAVFVVPAPEAASPALMPRALVPASAAAPTACTLGGPSSSPVQSGAAVTRMTEAAGARMTRAVRQPPLKRQQPMAVDSFRTPLQTPAVPPPQSTAPLAAPAASQPFSAPTELPSGDWEQLGEPERAAPEPSAERQCAPAKFADSLPVPAEAGLSHRPSDHTEANGRPHCPTASSCRHCFWIRFGRIRERLPR